MADNDTQAAQSEQTDEAGSAVVNAVRATEQSTDQQAEPTGAAPTLLEDPAAAAAESAAHVAAAGAPTETGPRGLVVSTQSAPVAERPNLA